MKSKKIRVALIFAIALFLLGAALFLYPYITKLQSDTASKNAVAEFESELENIKSGEENELLSRFYNDALRYNNDIFKNKQSGLKDQYSYQESLFNLSDYGLNTDVFGYVSIPKIDVELPIYLGATQNNMKSGAVHLTYTSLPLDCENANCVLAAHRGYRGAAFFKNIDKLEAGDTILVHTPWNVLTYTVCEIKIVGKDEIQQIYIREGKKLLTLSSCHPYTKNTHRYLVFAELTSAS